jgi:hypothetical protein
MSPWSDHESSSSLEVVLLLSAALMPRFDRVHNIQPHDFRALVEDLSRRSIRRKRRQVAFPGKTGALAWSHRWMVRKKRVNLPQARHAASPAASAMPVTRRASALTRRACCDHT